MTHLFATWLFAATWKSTLLVALVLALYALFRNRIPSRWLHALILVALLRLVAPMTPSASFSLFNLVPSQAAGAPVTIVVDGAATPVKAMRRVALPPLQKRPSAPWIPALLAVWGVGASIALVRIARQMFRFHRQLADRRDIARDDVRLLVEECREKLGVRSRIRVSSTDAVTTPSLHGWLRPTLLLPSSFLDSFTREQLRYVVLHELAHLRRSDVLVNWIASAAQVVHWFNPLVHLAATRLAEERELACDELALSALGAEERPAYGGTVLEIVDRQRGTAMVPALVGMTATPQQLKRRIIMIASFRRQSRHSLAFAALVTALALVTLTDASAGEIRVTRMKEALSPAGQAVMDSLAKTMSVQLTDARVEEILTAVTAATGTGVTFAEGALTDAVRNARITLSGTNVPAHIVLFESLSSVNLGVRFTDAGVEVITAPHHRHGEFHLKVHEGDVPPLAGGDGERRVIIVNQGAEPEEHSDRIIERKVEVSALPATDGSAGRKMKFRSVQNGVETEGTLEISVKP